MPHGICNTIRAVELRVKLTLVIFYLSGYFSWILKDSKTLDIKKDTVACHRRSTGLASFGDGWLIPSLQKVMQFSHALLVLKAKCQIVVQYCIMRIYLRIFTGEFYVYLDRKYTLPAYITIPIAASVFLIVQPRSKRLSMLKPIRSWFGCSLEERK